MGGLLPPCCAVKPMERIMSSKPVILKGPADSWIIKTDNTVEVIGSDIEAKAESAGPHRLMPQFSRMCPQVPTSRESSNKAGLAGREGPFRSRQTGSMQRAEKKLA